MSSLPVPVTCRAWQALYDKKIATFTMSLLCRWSEGEFEALAEGTDDAMVTE